MIKKIAIFGGAAVQPEDTLYQEVFEIAKLLAQNKYIIVNGGGPGVMLAATQGAQSVRGETLTVTFDPKDAPGFEGRYTKNMPDHEIKTDNYVDRMFTLMENSDMFVIANGGTGTISELGTAWCLARLYYGHHKPFILYGEFWKEIIEVLNKNLLIRDNDLRVFEIAKTPEEVLTYVQQFEKEMNC